MDKEKSVEGKNGLRFFRFKDCYDFFKSLDQVNHGSRHFKT
jgi:hypothetical protein